MHLRHRVSWGAYTETLPEAGVQQGVPAHANWGGGAHSSPRGSSLMLLMYGLLKKNIYYFFFQRDDLRLLGSLPNLTSGDGGISGDPQHLQSLQPTH